MANKERMYYGLGMSSNYSQWDFLPRTFVRAIAKMCVCVFSLDLQPMRII